MARDEAPPFDRGRTYYNGETIDVNDLGGVNLEGKEYQFEDTIYGTGSYVRLRIVRNVSGATLYGKRLASFKAGQYGRRVDGYTTVTAGHGFPIDELYATNGVPNNDLFWLVVEGPVAIKNGTGVVATTIIADKDPLVALTAAASTGASTTDAGRVRTADFSGATTPLANNIQNTFGHAMSAAATSGQTNVDILTFVTRSI